MKVLLFSSAPAVSGTRSGGSIVWSQAIVRMLRKRGHEVFIVTYGEQCDLLNCQEFREHLTFVSYKGNFSWIDSVIFKDIPRMVKAGRMVSDIVKANNIDIVITSSIHEAGGLLFYPPDIPIFAFCHGYYPYELNLWCDGKRRYPRLVSYWLIEQFGRKVCDGVICPSNWLKDKLKERLKGNEIYVIRNMIRKRPEVSDAISKEGFGLREDLTIIASCNKMIAPFSKMAFEIYLDTVRAIVTERKDVQFLLMGVDSNAYNYVVSAVKTLPVRVVGRFEDIFGMLKLADIFLHVSLVDTFSLTTLEAMSMGLPVVATSVGALPELVENDQTGLLVELNSEEIANTIINLIDDDVKKERLGEAAKNRVHHYYDEDEVGKCWEKFLLSQIRR